MRSREGSSHAVHFGSETYEAKKQVYLYFMITTQHAMENCIKQHFYSKGKNKGKLNSLDLKYLEMQLRKCGQVSWHWEKRMFPDLASILLLGQAPLISVHSSTFQNHLLIPSLPLAFLKRSVEDIPNWLSVLRRMGSQKPVCIFNNLSTFEAGMMRPFLPVQYPKTLFWAFKESDLHLLHLTNYF